MIATVKNNYQWEGYRGEVIREEPEYVIVKIQDKYHPKLSYNIRFPRTMVEFELPVAQA